MKKALTLIMVIMLMTGCGSTEDLNKDINNPTSKGITIDEVLLPEAANVSIKSDELVEIDYSNATKGYFMARTKSEDHEKLKIRIIKEDKTYDYDINRDLEYVTYPLNMGDGVYNIKICENIEGNRYAVRFALEIDVKLDDDFLPYLYPNIIIDYCLDDEVVAKSFELVAGDMTTLERVEHLYSYVVDNIKYDNSKLEAARLSFLIPDLNYTIDTKSGICIDYASLLCALLRIQQIPCKVITGYVDEGYHAWVSVYIDDNIGWITPEIYFEKENWNSADPTFDATKKNYDGPYEVKDQY